MAKHRPQGKPLAKATRRPHTTAPKAVRIGHEAAAALQAKTLIAQQAFLTAFVERGTVLGAAQAASIHRDTHYHWLKTDEAYRERFAQAEEEAVQMLETECRRRAMVGVDEPVFHKGKVCGHVKKYSDTLAIFILKSRRPGIYRERYDVTQMPLELSELTADELAVVHAAIQRQAVKRSATGLA